MSTPVKKAPVDTVLTIQQAAQYLGISVSTVRRLRNAGTIPAHRATPAASSHWRFMRSDLLKYLRMQQQDTNGNINVYTREAEATDLLDALIAEE